MKEPTCNISPRLHKALYDLVQHISNDIGLLAAVGSIGDTLPDDECAELIEDWMTTGHVLHGKH